MISQKTKERIRDQSKLPTHDDCEVKKKTSPLSALERLIYDQEPVDDGEWREQLRAAIAEAREAEATRAQWLVRALEGLIKSWDDAKLNAIRRDSKVYGDNIEMKIAKEALTNYNNPVNK